MKKKPFSEIVKRICADALKEIEDRCSDNIRRYNPKYNEDGSEKHVVCDGARYHVISYSLTTSGAEEHCSEPNCEINRDRERRAALTAKVKP